MRPFVINGDVWGVARLRPGDPRLIDRTDTPRLAVTDPVDRMVYVREDLRPPLLDRVVLHEVAHAVTVSWGLLPSVREDTLRGDVIGVEEWSAQLVENMPWRPYKPPQRLWGGPYALGGCALISLETIEREIDELEARETSYRVCERLSWLYVCRDHLRPTPKAKERPSSSTARSS